MLTHDLPSTLAERFIAREDVKARQFGGGYTKDTEPWTREALEAHLAGEASYGHYMLDGENRCKLFAFDIDLDKTATWENGRTFDPREVWLAGRSPARERLQRSLRALGEGLAWRIRDVLEVPSAVSYSGSKGLHVYGFTGLRPATEVMQAAFAVLDTGAFERQRGDHFWKHRSAFQAMTIEVFPKQTEVRSEGFGNLMRLPLGVHQKTHKPAFFLKLSAEPPKFVPDDPGEALVHGSTR